MKKPRQFPGGVFDERCSDVYLPAPLFTMAEKSSAMLMKVFSRICRFSLPIAPSAFTSICSTAWFFSSR